MYLPTVMSCLVFHVKPILYIYLSEDNKLPCVPGGISFIYLSTAISSSVSLGGTSVTTLHCYQLPCVPGGISVIYMSTAMSCPLSHVGYLSYISLPPLVVLCPQWNLCYIYNFWCISVNCHDLPRVLGGTLNTYVSTHCHELPCVPCETHIIYLSLRRP